MGQFVWLHSPAKKKGLSPKLQKRWLGPYLIVNQLSEVTYRIQQKPTGKKTVVHYDRLKPYLGHPLEPWTGGPNPATGASPAWRTDEPPRETELGAAGGADEAQEVAGSFGSASSSQGGDVSDTDPETPRASKGCAAPTTSPVRQDVKGTTPNTAGQSAIELSMTPAPAPRRNPPRRRVPPQRYL